MNRSMILITSTWQGRPTFKMIPTSLDCPYNEVLFDPDSKILAIVGKEKKQTFHMIPKLDNNGFPVLIKGAKANMGDAYQKERKILDSYYEYFITEEAEIRDFINRAAINITNFNLEPFFMKEEELQTAA